MSTKLKKLFISWSREGAKLVIMFQLFCIILLILIPILFWNNEDLLPIATITELIIFLLVEFLQIFVYPLRHYSGKTIRNNKFSYIILSDAYTVSQLIQFPILIVLCVLILMGYLQFFSIKFFMIVLILIFCTVPISKKISIHFIKKLLID